MLMNEYWLMVKKERATLQRPQNPHHGNKLPYACVIEWTPDELVYVWPIHSGFESLCLVCKNLDLKSSAVCNHDVQPGYPCRFSAVPEAEVTQDFDDFIIDGEYLDRCGYFYSFADFKRQNGYSDDDFLFYKVGNFSSIRAARYALPEEVKILSNFI